MSAIIILSRKTTPAYFESSRSDVKWPFLNHRGLLSKNHLDIKYHMAPSFFISYRNMLPILQYFEGYTDLVHIFCLCIPTQSVSIIFVRRYGFFNIVGNMDSKLVVTFPNSAIHQRNGAISLLKSIRHPPQKSWFILQAKSCCIIRHLNRV